MLNVWKYRGGGWSDAEVFEERPRRRGGGGAQRPRDEVARKSSMRHEQQTSRHQQSVLGMKAIACDKTMEICKWSENRMSTLINVEITSISCNKVVFCVPERQSMPFYENHINQCQLLCLNVKTLNVSSSTSFPASSSSINHTSASRVLRGRSKTGN